MQESEQEYYDRLNRELQAEAEDHNKRCYSKLKPGDSFVLGGVECFVEQVIKQYAGFASKRYDEIKAGHLGSVMVTYVDRTGVIRNHKFTAPVLIPILENGPNRT